MCRMEGEKSVSMDDIARMAGVSVATVSRVINQNGRYSSETERKVRSLIEKYGYVPNMAARGLKTRRSNFIGVIVPDITNEFFARIVQAVQNGLRAQGYMALVCNTGEDEAAEEQYLKMLAAADLAGLIFISGSVGAVEKSLRKLPAVYIDRAPSDSRDALVVESDNYGGACLAVQELYRKGCRRIACMQSAKVISTYSFRYSGYRDQLALYGLPQEEALHLQVDEISFRAAYQAIEGLLDRSVAFDGLFCASDWLALGAMAALEARGVRVPQDVKIVGFDDISVASLTAKPLTTIRQQTDMLGATAAEEILRLIGGAPVRAQRIQISVSLVGRKTT